MIRFLRRARSTALFAIAALLWQAALPLLPVNTNSHELLVAICGEHGVKMVALDIGASGGGESTPSAPDKSDCQLCASLGVVAISGPSNFGRFVRSVRLISYAQLAFLAPPSTRPGERYHPRAPPASA
jgi:hypothetical protein